MKFKFKARTDNWEGFFSYNHTDQARSVKAYIVQTPLFKGGEVSFDYLPCRSGKIWKIKKRGWKNHAGAGFLKRGGGWHFSCLIFSKFIIFTFRNYFNLCKIVLCIWRKIIFFCHHNFMKKGHSKLSKNEPENIPSIKITYL